MSSLILFKKKVLGFERLYAAFEHTEVVYVGSIHFMPYHLNAPENVRTLSPGANFKGSPIGLGYINQTHSTLLEKGETWVISKGESFKPYKFHQF